MTLVATEVILCLFDGIQSGEGLEVVTHNLHFVCRHSMGVPLGAFLGVPGPLGLRLLYINLISIVLRCFHVLAHLPQFDVRIVDDNQGQFLLHSFHCAFEVLFVIGSNHLDIVSVLALHHEEVVGGVDNAVAARYLLGEGGFARPWQSPHDYQSLLCVHLQFFYYQGHS